MLITFLPEDTKDFNVEGGSGLPKLPHNPDFSSRVYDIEAAIVNIEQVQKDNSPMKLAVTFEVTNPKNTGLSLGQQFGEALNIQHPKPIVSTIARQTIGKIAYGVTGDPKIMDRGTLNFDHSLYNKPFNIIVEASRSDGGWKDDKGESIYFVNNNIKKATPLAGGSQQQPQQGYNNNTQAPQQGYTGTTNQQPQTNTPNWGDPQR